MGGSYIEDNSVNRWLKKNQIFKFLYFDFDKNPGSHSVCLSFHVCVIFMNSIIRLVFLFLADLFIVQTNNNEINAEQIFKESSQTPTIK